MYATFYFLDGSHYSIKEWGRYHEWDQMIELRNAKGEAFASVPYGLLKFIDYEKGQPVRPPKQPKRSIGRALEQSEKRSMMFVTESARL